MKIWPIVLSALVSLIIGLFLGIIANQYFLFRLIDWAYFGDAFSGVLGVIISGIAVILIWRTYIVQKKELTETRKFLIEQLDADIVMKLIERKDKLIENSEIPSHQGYDFFRYLYREAMSEMTYNEYNESSNKSYQEILDEILSPEVEPIALRYLDLIKSITHILDKNDKDREEYLINIFKNSLSAEEISFLNVYLMMNEYKETGAYLYKHYVTTKETKLNYSW